MKGHGRNSVANVSASQLSVGSNLTVSHCDIICFSSETGPLHACRTPFHTECESFRLSITHTPGLFCHFRRYSSFAPSPTESRIVIRTVLNVSPVTFILLFSSFGFYRSSLLSLVYSSFRVEYVLCYPDSCRYNVRYTSSFKSPYPSFTVSILARTCELIDSRS